MFVPRLGDKQFFLRHIPSLERKQRSLDLGLPVLQQSKLKKCTVEIDKEVKVCRNLSIEANRRIIAIRNLVTALPLKQQIISIDIEWDLDKNAVGFITGQGTDINTPLSLHEATAGRVVGIKPSSKASMTTCAATAIIEPRGNWLAPGDKCKPMTLKATDSR